MSEYQWRVVGTGPSPNYPQMTHDTGPTHEKEARRIYAKWIGDGIPSVKLQRRRLPSWTTVEQMKSEVAR